MDALQKFLADWKQDTINRLKNRYRSYKQQSSGNFINKFESVNQDAIKKYGNSYEIVIKAPAEWKYVNYGVRGTQGGKSNKGYRFRSDYGMSKDGLRRIRMWMRQRGIVPNNYSTAKNKEKVLDRYAKRVIVPAIKRKGIFPAPFVDDVLSKKYLNTLKKDLVGQFKASVFTTIRK